MNRVIANVLAGQWTHKEVIICSDRAELENTALYFLTTSKVHENKSIH